MPGVIAVRSVLLFGGSFDPIHHGHLIIGRHAAEHLGVERVVLVPSASPPHKQSHNLSPAADRLDMCRLAVGDDPQFEVSDWEVGQPGPNYTLLTVQHFRQTCGDATALHWLIGMDSLAELGTWYHAAELVDACTIVTAARPGSEPPSAAFLGRWFSPAQIERLYRHILEGPRIDISARDIRARVRAGRSIRHLVPEPVRQYLLGHGLYRGE